MDINEAPKYETNEPEAPNTPPTEERVASWEGEAEVEEIVLPFSPKEYGKKGNLKKVRGSMLSKLFKAEMKHYLSFLLILTGVIFLSTLYVGIIDFPGARQGNDALFSATAFILYVFSLCGAAFYALIAPVRRYEKSLFGSEGYLTLSIPASMEEQVLAKRLSAVLVNVWTSALLLVSLLHTLSADIAFYFHGDIFTNYPVHAVFFVVEELLKWIVGLFALHAVFGASACFSNGVSNKKKILFAILFVYAISLLFNGVSALNLDFLNSPTFATLHITAWVTVLFEGAIAFGGFKLECWYLKNKLDLK